MDIHLIYLIKAFILPPAIFIFLGIFGFFYIARAIGKKLVFLSVLGQLVFSLPVTSYFLTKTWEFIPPITNEQLKNSQAQAVVVLGGGYSKTSEELDEDFVLSGFSEARVRYAAQVSRHTGLPIVVSGGNVLGKHSVQEADLMADELAQRYSIKVKWKESHSRNTAENAEQTFLQLSRENIDHIILVTHAFHMPRALYQFQQQGFKVTPAPTRFMSADTRWDVFMFIPSVNSMGGNFLILHEVVGFVWYLLRYG